MWHQLLQEPALWGFLGAFVYAAPRASACYFAARDNSGHWGRCLVDAVFAMIIGIVAAASLEPWIAHKLGDESMRQLRAISTVLGLLANPMAPGVVDALSGRLLRRLRGTE